MDYIEEIKEALRSFRGVLRNSAVPTKALRDSLTLSLNESIAGQSTSPGTLRGAATAGYPGQRQRYCDQCCGR